MPSDAIRTRLALALALVAAATLYGGVAAADHKDGCGASPSQDPVGHSLEDERVLVTGGSGEFSPTCADIRSGATVTWVNAGLVAHDPGDLNDAGECFRPALDTLDADGSARPIRPGDTYTVEFHWDGGATIEVHTSLNGRDLRTETCDVDDVADPSTLTTTDLTIPYICYLHPDNAGEVRLRAVP